MHHSNDGTRVRADRKNINFLCYTRAESMRVSNHLPTEVPVAFVVHFDRVEYTPRCNF